MIVRMGVGWSYGFSLLGPFYEGTQSVNWLKVSRLMASMLWSWSWSRNYHHCITM